MTIRHASAGHRWYESVHSLARSLCRARYAASTLNPMGVRAVVCWLRDVMGPGAAEEAGDQGKTLQRDMTALLQRLQLPVPLDLQQLADGIAEHRGRPITLVPRRLDPGAPVAAWAPLADADVVFYGSNLDPLHRFHAIAHELGHVFAGHEAHEEADGQQLLEFMLPDLSSELIRRMLPRQHRYELPAEREAELIASQIRLWSEVLADQPVTAPSEVTDTTVQRLAHTLITPRGEWSQ